MKDPAGVAAASPYVFLSPSSADKLIRPFLLLANLKYQAVPIVRVLATVTSVVASGL
jgi:hypothetical protein